MSSLTSPTASTLSMSKCVVGHPPMEAFGHILLWIDFNSVNELHLRLYGTLQVVMEQPPRRVLASRRLLFSEVRVPRLDPSPRRKRGLGFKTRGRGGGRRLPLVAVPDLFPFHGGGSWSLMKPRTRDVRSYFAMAKMNQQGAIHSRNENLSKLFSSGCCGIF